MSVPKETIWEAERHTLAKHKILRKYLDAWFPILGSTQRRVLFIDGFCGPGEYVGGEPGSPIVALQAAAVHLERFKGEAAFLFVDEDESRIAHLNAKLESFREWRQVSIQTKCDEFERTLEAVLDGLDKQKASIAPTFAFIDPFGFKGLPMRLIHRLLSHEKTETFINFNLNTINRFVEHPSPDIRRHIVDLFGSEEAVEVINTSTNRYDSLRRLYQRQLGLAAEYVRFFSMNGDDDRPIYDLFFAGNHPLGHYRMKEAMWKVDSEFGIRFSDATLDAQSLLFGADPVPTLTKQILNEFGGRLAVEVREIIDWTRDASGFLESHMRSALKQGEGTLFEVRSKRSDGAKRRQRSIRPETLIDFTGPPPTQGSLFG